MSELNDKNDDEGSCELVIYCHECKKHYQLNPDMIAVAISTQTNLWEVYDAITKYRCPDCKEKRNICQN